MACSNAHPTRRIVGYAHFQLVLDRRPCIRISYLKVSNSFQRKGVGTLLLASVLRLAEEILSLPCAHVCLSVLSSNSNAIAFYTRLGFVGVGGARWLLMRRTLIGPRGDCLMRAVRERWQDLAQTIHERQQKCRTPGTTRSGLERVGLELGNSHYNSN